MANAAPTSQSNPMADRRALEAFATQNHELEQVEGLLRQFNIFEALGAVRHELRHSDFLAFLLNPSENHTLGVSFLRLFLQELMSAADSDIEDFTIDPATWDFANVDVRREWRNIDILVADNNARLVVLIENKVDTSEHSGQLERYHTIVQKQWPGYYIFALYLTPDGVEPTHEHYKPIGYDFICRVVQTVADSQQDWLDPAVHLLMTHYAKMLRKHIVSDSDISDLCRNIYKQHRQALDLIYKHKPDRRRQITDTITRLMQEDPNWTRWNGGINWMTCKPLVWENSRHLDNILFGIFQYWEQPTLNFAIGISYKASTPDNRHNLWEMAQRLGWQPNRLSPKGDTIVYQHPLLYASDADVDEEELETLIQERWTAFLQDKYPKLREQLQGEKWLWEEGYVPPARPLRQEDVGVIAKRLVSADAELFPLTSGRHWYSFCPKEWMQSPIIYQENLPEIRSLLYLTFEIEPQKLNFLVQIRRGPEQEHVRQKLYQMAEREHWPGIESFRKRWPAVYKLPVLVAADYQLDQAKLQPRIEYRWAEFVEQHLPIIMKAVRQEEWLWNNDNETSR